MGRDQVFDFDAIAKVLELDRSTLPSNASTIAEPSAHQPMSSFQKLSDAEWIIIRDALPALPVPRPGGFRDREFIDAVIWYRVAKDRGRSWVSLPDQFPPRATVQHRWHRWCIAGTWQDIAAKLMLDGRLSAERRYDFERIATDAALKRERVLASRARLNECI